MEGNEDFKLLIKSTGPQMVNIGLIYHRFERHTVQGVVYRFHYRQGPMQAMKALEVLVTFFSNSAICCMLNVLVEEMNQVLCSLAGAY